VPGHHRVGATPEAQHTPGGARGGPGLSRHPHLRGLLPDGGGRAGTPVRRGQRAGCAHARRREPGGRRGDQQCASGDQDRHGQSCPAASAGGPSLCFHVAPRPGLVHTSRPGRAPGQPCPAALERACNVVAGAGTAPGRPEGRAPRRRSAFGGRGSVVAGRRVAGRRVGGGCCRISRPPCALHPPDLMHSPYATTTRLGGPPVTGGAGDGCRGIDEGRAPGPARGGRRRALGAGPRSTARRSLAALALLCGEVVTTDQLVDLVWAGSAPTAAVATLQSHVSQLRRIADDPDLVRVAAGGYVLAPAPRPPGPPAPRPPGPPAPGPPGPNPPRTCSRRNSSSPPPRPATPAGAVPLMREALGPRGSNVRSDGPGSHDERLPLSMGRREADPDGPRRRGRGP